MFTETEQDRIIRALNAHFTATVELADEFAKTYGEDSGAVVALRQEARETVKTLARVRS